MTWVMLPPHDGPRSGRRARDQRHLDSAASTVLNRAAACARRATSCATSVGGDRQSSATSRRGTDRRGPAASLVQAETIRRVRRHRAADRGPRRARSRSRRPSGPGACRLRRPSRMSPTRARRPRAHASRSPRSDRSAGDEPAGELQPAALSTIAVRRRHEQPVAFVQCPAIRGARGLVAVRRAAVCFGSHARAVGPRRLGCRGARQRNAREAHAASQVKFACSALRARRAEQLVGQRARRDGQRCRSSSSTRVRRVLDVDAGERRPAAPSRAARRTRRSSSACPTSGNTRPAPAVRRTRRTK